jgi:putative aldouronate transport system substrate-binding protein
MKWLVILGILVMVACPLLGAAAKTFKYPMKTNFTLKYWMILEPNVSAVYKNFGDSPLAKEWQKRAGVKCEFLHPAAPTFEQQTEAFNIMLASGDLPDIVEFIWQAIPGGPNAAINNGFILKLNNVYKRYAPNVRRWLKKNPYWDKQTKTDEGEYYVFPFIRNGDNLLCTSGPIIRKDWLDDLKMTLPETPDEWYAALKAFKEKKDAVSPLAMNLERLQANLGPGFNITDGNQRGFTVVKDKVRYSFNTREYKDFLTTLHKWFEEGLLDSNFANLTNKTKDANILSGKSGIVYGSAGSGLGVWMTTMAKKNPQFEVIGIKFPSPKRGQRAKYGKRSMGYGGYGNRGNAAISAKCKHVEAAARLLDYSYSREGHMLMNFGIEGVSYNMAKKYPRFTQSIINNPKLPFAKALSRYARSACNGPFIQDPRYIEQYYNLKQQQEGQKNWMANDMAKYEMPPVSPNDRESMELAQIMNDLSTYVKEMSTKFIMGVEPLGKYDQYVEQINKMGLAKAIKINQDAYNRYKKR